MIYSGTVAAVFEAAYWNHSALAISTYPDNRDGAAAQLDPIYNYIKDNNLFEYNPIYNVNIPHSPKGILITKQGSPYFDDGFKHIGDDMYLQTGEMIPDEYPNDLSRDTVALANGYISITPLTLSRINESAFNALKAKNL